MDTMTGGAENDKFGFDDGDFSSATSTGADVIVDFTLGNKINLSLVDALSTTTSPAIRRSCSSATTAFISGPHASCAMMW